MFKNAQRESVRVDGRGGDVSCGGTVDEDDESGGGGRGWMGEGDNLGAVASASGEEDGRKAGAGKEVVVPLGWRRRSRLRGARRSWIERCRAGQSVVSSLGRCCGRVGSNSGVGSGS